MRYGDWGERAPRWCGIRSETVEVCGTPVHYLRADASKAVPDAPVHLLVHPMAAAGSYWLDVITPLTVYGHVIAPDLPGTIFGETPAATANASRIAPTARFLRAFVSALGLERVVVHGWSMGGLVGLEYVILAPERVDRLVLASTPLPLPLSRLEWLGWQTVGRAAVSVGPPLSRTLGQLWSRRLIETKLSVLSESTPDALRATGADPDRIAPENVALWIDQLTALRTNPERMGYAATAFASVIRGILVDRDDIRDSIERVAVPVLLIAGGQDPMVVDEMIEDALSRRPDWDLHVFPSAGHLAPLELPEEYAATVGRWLPANDEAVSEPRIRPSA